MSGPPLELGQMIELARLSLRAAQAHATVLETALPGKGPIRVMQLLAEANREMALWLEASAAEVAREFADGLPGYDRP